MAMGIALWIVVAYLAGRYANFALLAYLTERGYKVIEQVKATSGDGALKQYEDSLSIDKSVMVGDGITGTEGFTDQFGVCPNCDSQVLVKAQECSRCKAIFGPNSAWKVRPLTRN